MPQGAGGALGQQAQYRFAKQNKRADEEVEANVAQEPLGARHLVTGDVHDLRGDNDDREYRPKHDEVLPEEQRLGAHEGCRPRFGNVDARVAPLGRSDARVLCRKRRRTEPALRSEHLPLQRSRLSRSRAIGRTLSFG